MVRSDSTEAKCQDLNVTSLTPEPHPNITLLSQIGDEPGPLWQFFYSFMDIFLQPYRSQKTVMYIFIDLNGSKMEGYSFSPIIPKIPCQTEVERANKY